MDQQQVGGSRGRRFRLDAGATPQHYYLFSEVSGPGAAMRSIEQMARRISAKHCLFGKVELNDDTFRSFVKNFEARTYGQDIQGDMNHRPEDGVTFTFHRLFTEGDRLLAEIEWSELGVHAFQKRGLKYFSIDFTDDYLDPETGVSHGPLLFGAALTPRPFIKNMRPTEGPGRMAFSEGGRSIFVPDYLKFEGASMTLAEILAAIRKKLSEMKLAAAVVTTLTKQFEDTANTLGIAEDGAKLQKLQESLEPSWKLLAEAPVPAPAATQLSEAQLSAAVNAALDAREQKAKQKTDSEAANRKKFTDAIDEAKGLSDKTKESLKKQASAIGSGLDDAQIKTLSDSAIEMGNQMEVIAQRAGLGLTLSSAGNIENIMVMGTIGSQVHGFLRERLLLSDSAGQLRLPEEKQLTAFARKVLAEFDRIHGHRLDAEHKHLSAGGVTNISDGAFPVSAQRQVIVELLADLQFLALVQTIVDPQAGATLQIPYEVRNTGSVKNGAIVYEGQPIPRAGVQQLMDVSYIVPRKIALLMSNEMIHFSRAAQINWDAWARNIASNARLMRDIIAAAIANELQRSADAYDAATVTGEAITAQVNGTRTLFKTAQFPIVRPKQVRDLQGNAVGNMENPITLTITAASRPEYDGTGTQTAGNYWQIVDYNLGLFQIVNQAGVVQALANATAVVISYSAATNVEKFDIDVPGGQTYEKHLNGLLNKIGRAKAKLNQERYVVADFAVTSATLHNTITEAEQFEESHAKSGTDLASTGDLGKVKNVPTWGTNQPGTDLSDSRIILGERGTLSYGIAKPFVTGMPFEAVDSNGKPTGQKQAYGEEYSSIHVPTPIRGRLRSVIVYSATARAAI